MTRLNHANGLLKTLRASILPLGLAAALALAGPAPGHATTISLDDSVTGTSFTPSEPTSYPATVTFALTFSNASDIMDSSAGLTVTANNTFAGTALFSYVKATDTLYIGADGSAGNIGYGTDDFRLTFTHVSTAPDLTEFVVAQSSGAFVLTAGSTTVQAAAPEPLSISLLGVGLAGIGLVRRQRTGAAQR